MILLLSIVVWSGQTKSRMSRTSSPTDPFSDRSPCYPWRRENSEGCGWTIVRLPSKDESAFHIDAVLIAGMANVEVRIAESIKVSDLKT